jgi:hypothetical protein
MEDLAPPLRLCLSIRFDLERNLPVTVAVQNFLAREKEKEWRELVQMVLTLAQAGKSPELLLNRQKSRYRRATLSLIVRGHRGEPIYSQLCQIEEEMLQASQEELEQFHLALPIRTLLPLLLLQFPAFLILLIGPLIATLFSA